MTTERRMLLEKDALDDFERQLLEAGAQEAPRASVREGALAAMGIGKDGGGRGGQGTANGRPAVKRAIKPWIGMGVVTVVGLGLAIALWSSSQKPRVDDTPPPAREPAVTPIASAILPAVETAPPVVENAPPALAAEPLVNPPPATSPTTRSPVATAKSSDVPPAASGESGLSAEVAALEVVRTAIAHGDKTGALRALDDYRRRFPGGIMRQEAAVLRIEALAKGGDLGAARAVADQFLAANPKSPHAQRIRRLVGEEP